MCRVKNVKVPYVPTNVRQISLMPVMRLTVCLVTNTYSIEYTEHKFN